MVIIIIMIISQYTKLYYLWSSSIINIKYVKQAKQPTKIHNYLDFPEKNTPTSSQK